MASTGRTRRAVGQHENSPVTRFPHNLNARKRKFEHMSQDELIGLVLQTGLQPPEKRTKKRNRKERVEDDPRKDTLLFPDMPELRRVLNMPGPPLCQATMEGKKIIENRSKQMPLGVYVLRCANGRDWKKDLLALKSEIDKLPYASGSLDHLHG